MMMMMMLRRMRMRMIMRNEVQEDKVQDDDVEKEEDHVRTPQHGHTVWGIIEKQSEDSSLEKTVHVFLNVAVAAWKNHISD